MDNEALDNALSRAERALARVERIADDASRRDGPDEALRAKVRDAIAKLDQLIQKAEA